MGYHVPVLADPVVAYLSATPVGPIVDGTLGGGGHSELLLRDPLRKVIGIDRDPDALAHARARLDNARFVALHGDFGDLPAALRGAGLPVEGSLAGLLLDLGVSSWQLDQPGRGFGLKHEDGPLDMRMDATAADRMTAADMIGSLDVGGLARILRQFGEVPSAGRIAGAIKDAEREGRLNTTGDLARVVASVQKPVRSRRGAGGRTTHPATTVFQALRVAVNDELGALDRALAEAPALLMPGGRLAVIAYHSLEDRRVKHAFRLGERGPSRPGHLPPPSGWTQVWNVLTSKPVGADDAEVERNPRSRSARLRVAERVASC